MRLISCHIDNFGKISNYDLDFTEGINEIYADNGFGKSTLAAFLKVMFYGFSNENKHDEIINERKRYNPWQGGVYGGTVVFEVNGKEYELTRQFGDKKGNVFVLRNNATKLDSDDYSEKIGEEIFGIDGESYCRTIYIGDNDCKVEVNSNINAKIGNLVDNTGDINNYDSADKQLLGLWNQMNPNKKSGELAQLNSQINALKMEIKEGLIIDESSNKIMELSSKDKEELEAIGVEQKTIGEQLSKVATYKDKKANKDRYEELVKEYKARASKREDAKAYFPGNLPIIEELNDKIQASRQLSELAGVVKGLESQVNNANEENDSKDKLEKLELKFSAGIPDNDKIALIGKTIGNMRAIKAGLSAKRNNAAKLQQVEDEAYERECRHYANKAKVTGMIGGITFLIALILVAAGLTVLSSMPLVFAGIICIIAAVTLIVLSGHAKASINKVERIEDEELTNLLIEIEEDENYIKDAELEIEDFFIMYNLSYNEEYASDELYKLRRDIDDYRELSEKCKKEENIYKDKKKRYDDAKREYDDKVEGIKAYINDLGFVCKEDLNSQLVDLLNASNIHNNCNNEYVSALKLKEDFEEAHPDYESYADLEEIEENQSLEELEMRRSKNNMRTEELLRNINSYRTQLDEFGNKREIITEKENLLEVKEEQYEEALLRFDDITKTRDYLRLAKENLTNRYTKPVKDGIDKYYRKCTGENNTIELDANLQAKYKEQGLSRNVETLSHGLRDLTGLCMRLALVDVMFKEEKPYIILDDPFVNLDNEKIAGGYKLIEDISQEYQVIYFTCHESRTKNYGKGQKQ